MGRTARLAAVFACGDVLSCAVGVFLVREVWRWDVSCGRVR